MKIELFVLFVAFVAAVAATETVTYVSCQDGQCKTDCLKKNYAAGECLDGQRVSCYDGPAMCNNMLIYQDAQCSDTSTMTVANNVCGSCQQHFMAECGALHNAMYISVNCTDSECQNCGASIIVPFGECKLVAPLGYVMVTAVTQCTVVSVTDYSGSSCTGPNVTQKYESGKCFDGKIVRCN